MSNKVSLSKVASDLNLSVSTVSRALSGCGRVSETTRQAVHEYLNDNNVSPNTRKRRYEDLKKNIIAITMPSEEDSFNMSYFQTILSSVYDYFSIRDYQVIVIKIGQNDIGNLERAVENHAMDGVIITRQIEQNDEVELLMEEGVPFVLLGKADNVDIMQIELDIENACFDLTNTLIGKGYTKLAIMGAKKQHPVNLKRMNGIKRACINNYVSIHQDLLFWETETEAVAEMALEKIIAMDVDCVICLDDNICLKILYILQRLGKSVPQDIRVASLHNNPMLNKWSPPITCVSYDIQLLAREAGKILYTYLEEKKKMPKMKIGYEIELKGSTK